MDSGGTLPIDHDYLTRARECSCDRVERVGGEEGEGREDEKVSLVEMEGGALII